MLLSPTAFLQGKPGLPQFRKCQATQPRLGITCNTSTQNQPNPNTWEWQAGSPATLYQTDTAKWHEALFICASEVWLTISPAGKSIINVKHKCTTVLSGSQEAEITQKYILREMCAGEEGQISWFMLCKNVNRRLSPSVSAAAAAITFFFGVFLTHFKMLEGELLKLLLHHQCNLGKFLITDWRRASTADRTVLAWVASPREVPYDCTGRFSRKSIVSCWTC